MVDNKIKVMVIDDSLLFRSFLSNALKKDEEIEVVGTAMHGKAALSSIPLLNPDVCTLDFEMPEMNGIETLREIKKRFPRIQVIMVSSKTSEGADVTLEAMESGASDFVLKDESEMDPGIDNTKRLPEVLIKKIKRAHKNALFTTQIDAVDHVVQERKKTLDSVQSLVLPGTKPFFLSICCEESSLGHLLLLVRNIHKNINVPVVFKIMVPEIFLNSLIKSFQRGNFHYKYCLGINVTSAEPNTVYLFGEKHQISPSISSKSKVDLQVEVLKERVNLNVYLKNFEKTKVPNTPVFLLADDMHSDGAAALKGLTQNGYPTVFAANSVKSLNSQKNVLANSIIEVNLLAGFINQLFGI